MDFFNVFKSFFGFPNSVHPHDFNSERYENIKEDSHNHFIKSEVDNDEMGFQIFANPLEMQRYFEQQLNEIARSFGENTLFGNIFPNPNLSAVETQTESTSKNLRDIYLKPDYERHNTSAKTDSDLDGKVNIKELDTILEPNHRFSAPKSSFFGQSVITRTIAKPDGSIEMTRRISDHLGNEETSVTHRHGDQEHIIVTKIVKNGQSVTDEKLVTIEEGKQIREIPDINNFVFSIFNDFFK
ncbi:PREDICTED: uncharacterized protein LOC108559852 [Nicrophorus vespilloides]|uniref:Uncharacterized protein LOC108559852 n=1 Tax=Nicrophorus vespilloides TaxID=110193 RepID=A0ABM1MDQ9_NICVS|nr:PREDICTED: uncharacterized protein LOC108559852 [Nicrophorus vespilloides]